MFLKQKFVNKQIRFLSCLFVIGIFLFHNYSTLLAQSAANTNTPPAYDSKTGITIPQPNNPQTSTPVTSTFSVEKLKSNSLIQTALDNIGMPDFFTNSSSARNTKSGVSSCNLNILSNEFDCVFSFTGIGSGVVPSIVYTGDVPVDAVEFVDSGWPNLQWSGIPLIQKESNNSVKVSFGASTLIFQADTLVDVEGKTSKVRRYKNISLPESYNFHLYANDTCDLNKIEKCEFEAIIGDLDYFASKIKFFPIKGTNTLYTFSKEDRTGNQISYLWEKVSSKKKARLTKIIQGHKEDATEVYQDSSLNKDFTYPANKGLPYILIEYAHRERSSGGENDSVTIQVKRYLNVSRQLQSLTLNRFQIFKKNNTTLNFETNPLDGNTQFGNQKGAFVEEWKFTNIPNSTTVEIKTESRPSIVKYTHSKLSKSSLITNFEVSSTVSSVATTIKTVRLENDQNGDPVKVITSFPESKTKSIAEYNSDKQVSKIITCSDLVTTCDDSNNLQSQKFTYNSSKAPHKKVTSVLNKTSFLDETAKKYQLEGQYQQNINYYDEFPYKKRQTFVTDRRKKYETGNNLEDLRTCYYPITPKDKNPVLARGVIVITSRTVKCYSLNRVYFYGAQTIGETQTLFVNCFDGERCFTSDYQHNYFSNILKNRGQKSYSFSLTHSFGGLAKESFSVKNDEGKTSYSDSVIIALNGTRTNVSLKNILYDSTYGLLSVVLSSNSAGLNSWTEFYNSLDGKGSIVAMRDWSSTDRSKDFYSGSFQNHFGTSAVSLTSHPAYSDGKQEFKNTDFNYSYPDTYHWNKTLPQEAKMVVQSVSVTALDNDSLNAATIGATRPFNESNVADVSNWSISFNGTNVADARESENQVVMVPESGEGVPLAYTTKGTYDPNNNTSNFDQYNGLGSNSTSVASIESSLFGNQVTSTNLNVTGTPITSTNTIGFDGNKYTSNSTTPYGTSTVESTIGGDTVYRSQGLSEKRETEHTVRQPVVTKNSVTQTTVYNQQGSNQSTEVTSATTLGMTAVTNTLEKDGAKISSSTYNGETQTVTSSVWDGNEKKEFTDEIQHQPVFGNIIAKTNFESTEVSKPWQMSAAWGNVHRIASSTVSKNGKTSTYKVVEGENINQGTEVFSRITQSGNDTLNTFTTNWSHNSLNITQTSKSGKNESDFYDGILGVTAISEPKKNTITIADWIRITSENDVKAANGIVSSATASVTVEVKTNGSWKHALTREGSVNMDTKGTLSNEAFSTSANETNIERIGLKRDSTLGSVTSLENQVTGESIETPYDPLNPSIKRTFGTQDEYTKRAVLDDDGRVTSYVWENAQGNEVSRTTLEWDKNLQWKSVNVNDNKSSYNIYNTQRNRVIQSIVNDPSQPSDRQYTLREYLTDSVGAQDAFEIYSQTTQYEPSDIISKITTKGNLVSTIRYESFPGVSYVEELDKNQNTVSQTWNFSGARIIKRGSEVTYYRSFGYGEIRIPLNSLTDLTPKAGSQSIVDVAVSGPFGTHNLDQNSNTKEYAIPSSLLAEFSNKAVECFESSDSATKATNLQQNCIRIEPLSVVAAQLDRTTGKLTVEIDNIVSDGIYQLFTVDSNDNVTNQISITSGQRIYTILGVSENDKLYLSKAQNLNHFSANSVDIKTVNGNTLTDARGLMLGGVCLLLTFSSTIQP